jgi:hypothetical protein
MRQYATAQAEIRPKVLFLRHSVIDPIANEGFSFDTR